MSSPIAEADAVEIPEEARVDQGAGHPGFVRGLPHHLEGRLGDAQGRPPEAVVAASLEAEARVVGRRALQEDERLRPAADTRQRVPDESGADALPLTVAH